MSDSMMAMLIQFGPILLMFVVFYLILIIPEKKRKKKYQEMLEELKVNDDIITKGGIIGRIYFLDKETITLETSTSKTKIKIDKAAVAHKVEKNS